MEKTIEGPPGEFSPAERFELVGYDVDGELPELAALEDRTR
jgi:hypothetical protein